MPNIRKNTHFEQIELYYTNDAKLTEKQKLVAERWELSFALLQKHKSKKVAVSKLIHIEKRKGNKLSVAQAYRDMNHAEELFVPLHKYSKDLLRHVLIESAIKDLQGIQERLKGVRTEDGNRIRLTNSEFTKLLEMKNRVEYRLIELSGIDEDNPDLPDFSKLEMHQYNISLPEGTQKMFDSIMNQGVIDATDLARTVKSKSKADE